METAKIYEAKTNFSALVDRAAGGERMIIAKVNQPVAMLVPIERQLEPREPVTGLHGAIDEAAWKAADREIEAMFEDAANNRGRTDPGR